MYIEDSILLIDLLESCPCVGITQTFEYLSITWTSEVLICKD